MIHFLFLLNFNSHILMNFHISIILQKNSLFFFFLMITISSCNFMFFKFKLFKINIIKIEIVNKY
jgi:hypothetical protein